ncbi:sex comb on midleg-like protein 1 [Arvicola amphibius]|uniref:sex comb on midleg-like protein 1 n=1 Tax=Arvicola amphibius TaxID=1047088 RepID=UPI001C0810BD|nr:sex comb on midleg-like protein 1 [Arvicola amphibius]
MAASKEMAVKEPQPSEIREIEEPKTIVDIMNHIQAISKAIQSLEKKFDDMNNKVTKIYYSRSRSFWHYPPLKSVVRRYNYLSSKRLKLMKESRVDQEDTYSFPQSYSPTSPVRRRDEESLDIENDEIIDYTRTYQYSDSVDNAQMFQYPDSIDNAQTYQYSDSIGNAQTYQYSDSIGNAQTFQYADSIDNAESIQNTKNDAVFHYEDSQRVVCISSSESDFQASPLSPIYTAQNYQQYCRFKKSPGSSTMTHYSDLENPNLDTTTSSTSTMMKESTLPQGELIPIQNPEMKRLALLEAQSTPVIDPNTFGLSSKCTKAVVRDLGKPLNWSVNDVITFLNRLDPPLADQLYATIREHDIDGKALLLLSTDVMIKYVRMKVGVALKLSSYIQKLKKGVNCKPEVTYGPTLARSDCVSSPAWVGIGVNDQSAGMDSVRGPCRNYKGSKDPGADEEVALAPGLHLQVLIAVSHWLGLKPLLTATPLIKGLSLVLLLDMLLSCVVEILQFCICSLNQGAAPESGSFTLTQEPALLPCQAKVQGPLSHVADKEGQGQLPCSHTLAQLTCATTSMVSFRVLSWQGVWPPLLCAAVSDG